MLTLRLHQQTHMLENEKQHKEKKKRKRNAVNNLLNKAQQEFYTNFIEENSLNQRRVFRASKCVT